MEDNGVVKDEENNKADSIKLRGNWLLKKRHEVLTNEKENKNADSVDDFKDNRKKAELIVHVAEKELDLFKKACSLEGYAPEYALDRFIENRAHSYEENSIYCDDCGKTIKEDEEYFVKESSVNTYEKQKDRVVETKKSSWENYCLCMDCELERASKKIPFENRFVLDYDHREKR